MGTQIKQRENLLQSQPYFAKTAPNRSSAATIRDHPRHEADHYDYHPSLSTIASASAATEKTLVPSRPNSTISSASHTLVESEAESTLRGQPSFESDIESSKTILGH